jgi:hypothetical protein
VPIGVSLRQVLLQNTSDRELSLRDTGTVWRKNPPKIVSLHKIAIFELLFSKAYCGVNTWARIGLNTYKRNVNT